MSTVQSIFSQRRSADRRRHSFPTRRSSDLAPRGPIGGLVVDGTVGYAGHAVAMLDARSEEHTSELQSHSDLVCRLLLEKNKILRQDTAIFNINATRLDRKDKN